MRITVDKGRCIGAGMCALTAPELFDQHPDDGLVVLLQPDPPPDRTGVARQAGLTCPAGAITIIE